MSQNQSADQALSPALHHDEEIDLENLKDSPSGVKDDKNSANFQTIQASQIPQVNFESQ